MRIGEISNRSGVSRDTIRYYEKLGLLTIESRDRENNYKHYGRQAVDRLTQIQRLKDVGFTLNEIRQLLCENSEKNRCEDLPMKLNQKIKKIDAQIVALHSFKTSLLEVQRTCDGACGTLNGMPTCMPSTIDSAPRSKCC